MKKQDYCVNKSLLSSLGNRECEVAITRALQNLGGPYNDSALISSMVFALTPFAIQENSINNRRIYCLLKRIARFAAIDYLRKESFFPPAERKRQQALSESGFATPSQYFEDTLHDAETETPESLLEQKQFKLQVRQALKKLPEQERALLKHLYFYDKPLNTFCKHSNRSGYLSKLHKRALRSLRLSLEGLSNRSNKSSCKYIHINKNLFL